jgi:hypothetical protein
MADIFTQIFNVLVAVVIYILIIFSIPLVIYQSLQSFIPNSISQINFTLQNSLLGRISLTFIKYAFLINLIIAILLFYFFTWHYLLPAF